LNSKKDRDKKKSSRSRSDNEKWKKDELIWKLVKKPKL
jgi:hypothetical protein